MAEVHQFALGWYNPALAYVLSFLGSLLGLVLATRARDSAGASRARWLALSAVSIGGTGIWLMHFMAMIGFDVPATTVRYDVPITVASVFIAVLIVGIGLFIVGMGKPALWKVLLGGVFTGLGVAGMHYTGMYAIRMGGVMSFDRNIVILSVVIAVVAATVALWFALVIRGASATIGAALLMAAAVCSMHYTGMAAIRVRLSADPGMVEGVSPFVLLVPISVLACMVIAALAYATVGFSVNQETENERELLERVREMHEAQAAAAAAAATTSRPGFARYR